MGPFPPPPPPPLPRTATLAITRRARPLPPHPGQGAAVDPPHVPHPASPSAQRVQGQTTRPEPAQVEQAGREACCMGEVVVEVEEEV